MVLTVVSVRSAGLYYAGEGLDFRIKSGHSRESFRFLEQSGLFKLGLELVHKINQAA